MSWLDELVTGERTPQNLEQGSEQWENIRAGRFTSSEIYRIMEFGYRPMTEKELKDWIASDRDFELLAGHALGRFECDNVQMMGRNTSW